MLFFEFVLALMLECWTEGSATPTTLLSYRGIDMKCLVFGLTRSLCTSVGAAPFLLGTIFYSTPFVFSNDPESLESVLKKESSGQPVIRKLAEGVQPVHESDGWHAGMIKSENGWKSLDQLSSNQKDDEYLKKREELAGQPQRDLELARWCAKQQFVDRSRAHYFGVLSKESNNLEARKYLGHVLVDDSWIDQTELKNAQLKMRQTLDTLDIWVPKLKEIVKDLQSGHSKEMIAALRKLDKIDTQTALPALEFFACNIDADLAKPLIKKIASVRTQDACNALIQVAIVHPSGEIRTIACESIRKYPDWNYVPELLNLMSSEIAVENRLVMQPNGNVSLVSLFTNELQNRKQVQRAQQLVSVVSTFSSSHSVNIFEKQDWTFWSNRLKIPKSNPVIYYSMTQSNRLASSSVQAVYVPLDVASSVAENLREQGKQQESVVAQQNRKLKVKLNQVCSLLRTTTGVDLEDKPELWWSWWNDYNERYQGEKPTSYLYNRLEKSTIPISTAFESNSLRFHHTEILSQFSCLVPGTLIQTADGLVPIEQIQIGDLVLSQNIETAELTIKPVILTTIRPPKETFKIVSGSNLIEATGGHLWWVSGHGWTKTRDLTRGMMLHTATGTSEVETLEQDPTLRQTHNLVVDGFHTYFVGSERVLSYDNSLVRPTLRSVPGYGTLVVATR